MTIVVKSKAVLSFNPIPKLGCRNYGQGKTVNRKTFETTNLTRERIAMPHLTVEYTNNLPLLNADALLHQLNEVLLASGQFEAPDIKSRAIGLNTFLVGTTTKGHGFIHAKLAILSGRSAETKYQLSHSLLKGLEQHANWSSGLKVQLCVEIQEIERASYAKVSVGS